MSVEMDNLEAQVKRVTTVNGSAVTLIKGLADRITAIKTDPVKLQALADELNSDASSLAAAVEANTLTPPSP